MALQPIIVQWDPMYVFHWNTSIVDFTAGDMLTLDSGVVTLQNYVEESVGFIGIAAGTEDRGTVPVHLRCKVRMNLVSAAYNFGAGLKYSSRETLVADSSEYTLGWFFEPAKTTDWGCVLFDTPRLENNNFDVISA